MKIWKGVSKKWVFQKLSKTQGSEEIFKKKVKKIKFGSLEKGFSKQKMVRSKRKCKKDRACEYGIGGRRKREQKKKRWGRREEGQNFVPPPPLFPLLIAKSTQV